jgi:mono/diheme cytochrome c family protein
MNRRPRWLITTCLATLTGCSSGSSSAVQAAAAPDPGAGERIYRGSCIPCHQENGAGLAGVYPSLAASSVVLGDPGDLARWVVKGRRPAAIPEGRYSTTMPRFGWLTPGDGAALLSYVRTHFGNAAEPVSAVRVAEALGE